MSSKLLKLSLNGYHLKLTMLFLSLITKIREKWGQKNIVTNTINRRALWYIYFFLPNWQNHFESNYDPGFYCGTIESDFPRNHLLCVCEKRVWWG